MSEAEFEAFRAKAKVMLTEATRPGAAVKVAKARTAVTRPGQMLATATAYIPVKPEASARHSMAVDASRVCCVDPSVSKSGVAWGKPGEKPEGSMVFIEPGSHKSAPECERVAGMAASIVFQALTQKCGLIVFSEFYSTKFMLSARINMSLRGALMAEAWRHGLRCIGVPEITARKNAGVDLSRPGDNEEPKGYMKRRARAFLESVNLGHLQEDQGDAAILLMGCKGLFNG